MEALARFGPMAQAWFTESFLAPTRVQTLGWDRIAAGDHTLMLAPTGSGKTLAAFLWCLDRLTRAPRPGAGTRVIYVSPIKALAYDVERNLRAPLAGLARVAARTQQALAPVTVDVRTGDTSPAARRRQLAAPGEILITTPESLYLLLGSRARAGLTRVETVIIDEIHALAPTKRGVHLALSLERLSALVTGAGGPDPQRIGLSATQRPLALVARYLGGDRPVAIVDAGERPRLDLEIMVPVPDMASPGPGPPARGAPEAAPPAAPAERGLWPAIYPRLLDRILAHRSTLLFVNSRRLAERLAQQLSQLAQAEGRAPAGQELVRAHHGSVARHQREQIEEELKAGRLRAITATSSLELGIDMGAVELVIQVESPGSVSRGLQRIGRSGHQVGGTPRGRIVPKFRGDLLEAAVVVQKMLAGEVEAITLPENTLDVLAQQIVAMCAVEVWPVDALARVVRRAASFRDLSQAALVEVLDMLAGRYPSDELAELRPRLSWDRAQDLLTARRGARLVAVVNAGTIPDRGLFAVHLGVDGPRVGELDEEMVHESRPGETFLLGASTWRIEAITRDRVIVSPAPGEPGKMPFWRGEGPGRPVELGRAMGGFVRRLDAALACEPEAATRAWLGAEHRLDAHAATNLMTYVAEQRAATGAVPTNQAITVERFRDELGDWRVCILTPFGGRVHAPWALLLEGHLARRLGYPVHPLWTDDGIALRFADGDALPADHELFPDPDEVDDALVDELARSSVFASHFRENAARALLLPRRRPGQRTPLWAQRLRAQQLLGVALRYPSFPIVLETYREVLRDVFDVPALKEVLGQVRAREIRVEAAATVAASPFARSLVFDYVAAYLYEGDGPVAERKAQALTLDRALLRALLGDGELRDLLDPQVLLDVEAELQGLAGDRRAAGADDVHDLLRRVGELSHDEVATRAGRDPGPWLAALASAGRAVLVRIGGLDRWIATEDAARYRDGLGVALPAGLPAALLAATDAPLAGLVRRWARTHGPFVAAPLATRWALPVGAADAILHGCAARGELTAGGFRPAGQGLEYVDPEVLRRIRRRTLARLRAEVAPVDAAALGRFLPRWHDVGAGRRGLPALRDALARLEGCPLPFAELEARLLPARVADFAPRMLDELGAMGELVWVGAGALGPRDGRVALYRRDRAALLVAAGAIDGVWVTALHRAIVGHLRQHGASFLVAIEAATGGASRDAVRAALWDLAWAGGITNDTFAPLRSLRAPPGRRVNPTAAFGGRWALVETLISPRPPSTARAHALATTLLDRWGVVAREAALADGVPGGFAAVADVLRAMEESGTARRGYFVEGISGRQYAWPATVDRLRAERDDRAPEIVAIAAVDPANPFGSLVPWPPPREPAARPSRRVGASVVLVGGRPALWVEPRGKRITTFAGLADDELERACRLGLPAVAATTPRRSLVIEHVDGEKAMQSPLAPVLGRAGARADYRGLVFDRGASGRATLSATAEPEPAADEHDLPDDDAAEVDLDVAIERPPLPTLVPD